GRRSCAIQLRRSNRLPSPRRNPSQRRRRKSSPRRPTRRLRRERPRCRRTIRPPSPCARTTVCCPKLIKERGVGSGQSGVGSRGTFRKQRACFPGVQNLTPAPLRKRRGEKGPGVKG